MRNRRKREFPSETLDSPNVGPYLPGRAAEVGYCFGPSGRAEGSDPTTDETIKMSEFNGFSDTYISRDSINRPWNWVALASPT
jgi:hypothetical protein